MADSAGIKLSARATPQIAIPAGPAVGFPVSWEALDIDLNSRGSGQSPTGVAMDLTFAILTSRGVSLTATANALLIQLL